MAKRPNYGQQRAERNRAARDKTAAKVEMLRERAERRKSEREEQAPDADAATASDRSGERERESD